MDEPKKKVVTDGMGMIKGYITEDENGKKTVMDFHGKVLGTSDMSGTRDFMGKRVSMSDAPELLIPDDEDDD